MVALSIWQWPWGRAMAAEVLIAAMLSVGISLVGYIGIGLTKRVATLERKMEMRHLENAERLTRIETLLGEENGRRHYRGTEGEGC